MADEEKKAKVKRPTAIKRDIQNAKRRLNNQVMKSKVRTSLRSLSTAITAKDKDNIQQKLDSLYSVIDRCTKKGIYKRNKAARLKSQASQKVTALIS